MACCPCPNLFSYENGMRLGDEINDQQLNTQFGRAVALSKDGSIMVVGARGYDVGESEQGDNAGAAFVFERKVDFSACITVAKKQENTKYVLVQKLLATNPKTKQIEPSSQALFGTSVAISADGSRIAIGAVQQSDKRFPSSDFPGAVYLFDRTNGKKSCKLYEISQKIIAQRFAAEPEDAEHCEKQCPKIVPDLEIISGFGEDIALSPNGQVLLASNNSFPAGQGLAYFYTNCPRFGTVCTNKSNFRFSQRLDTTLVAEASGVPVGNILSLGQSVSLNESGQIAFISAPFTAVETTEGLVFNAGVVFVYEKKSLTSTKWVYRQTLQQQEPTADDSFGLTVRVTPDSRFVAVELFTGDGVGEANTVTVFSRKKDSCTKGSGNCKDADSALYVFRQQLTTNEGINSRNVTLIKSLGISNDGCIISVGLELTSSSPSTVDGVGAVIVYRKKANEGWVMTQILREFPTPRPNARFGSALALNGSVLAVGSAFVPQDDRDYVLTFNQTIKK